MHTTLGLAALILTATPAAGGWPDALLADPKPLPQVEASRPAVGVPVKLPLFGTTLTRITGRARGEKAGVCPDYSKRQAWNADESRLLLRSTDGTVRLHDGATYAFLRTAEGVGGEDLFWHPTDPNVLLYNPGNELRQYRLDTGASETVFVFKGYEFANTRGEGNLSRDGTLYAVVGQGYDQASGAVTFKAILVLDVPRRKLVRTIALPGSLDGFDWVSISPSGRYVVVDYATAGTGRYQGVEVYTLSDGKLVWQKGLGAGHSDLALDADGSDVLVMDVYDPDANQTLYKKFRLKDGAETTLLATTQAFDQHISCRNTAGAAGWCVISTFDNVGRLTHSASDWLAFEDEIFALRLDGSRAVRRLAHHHSRRYSPSTPDSDRSVYFAEPHATVSPRGDRVLFGSNWSQGVGEEASVDTYVIDLRSPPAGPQAGPRAPAGAPPSPDRAPAPQPPPGR